MGKIPKRKKITKRSSLPRDLFISHAEEIRNIIEGAVRDALRIHKLLGHSVATMKGNKVVLIPAEKIPVYVDRSRKSAKSVTGE